MAATAITNKLAHLKRTLIRLFDYNRDRFKLGGLNIGVHFEVRAETSSACVITKVAVKPCVRRVTSLDSCFLISRFQRCDPGEHSSCYGWPVQFTCLRDVIRNNRRYDGFGWELKLDPQGSRKPDFRRK